MATFLKVTRAAPRLGEPALEFIELQPDGVVTRTVHEDLDGELLSNSVAILAHRSSAFADYAYGRPNPSLWTVKPPPPDDASAWAALGCTIDVVTPAEFGKLFQSARPAI